MKGGSQEGINPVDIAGAVSMLRFDTIKSIKWEIKPSVGIVAKDVNRLGMDIRSFRAPLAKIVREVMIPSIRTNFAQQGRPKWAPLAASTVMARNGATGPILNRTGLLARRARQFNIWDIGEVSATIRRLPADVFYGVYHQAGAERETGSGGNNNNSAILAKKGSSEAKALINKFIPRAARELNIVGAIKDTDKKRVLARALGMAMDAGVWTLPARPFIMYQDSDIPKMELIFLNWMEERARHVGRFNDRG
jgi:phage gpG-like protein